MSQRLRLADTGISLHAVSGADSRNFDLVKKYYAQMKKDFGMKGELPRLSAFKAVLAKNKTSKAIPIHGVGRHREAWLFLVKDKEPIACLNYDVLSLRDDKFVAVILYVDVAPEYRSHGLAHILLDLLPTLALEYMANVSQRHGISRPEFLGVFAEVNDAEEMSFWQKWNDKRLSGVSTKKRLEFWKKRGFKRLDFDYIQPSIGQGEVGYLSLAFCPHKGRKSLDRRIVANYLLEFCGFTVSNKKNAQKDKTIEKMVNEIYNKKQVALVELI